MIGALDQDKANVFDGRRAAESTQRACAVASAAISAIPDGQEMPSKGQALAGRVIADCQASMRARADTAGEIARLLSTNQSSFAIKALEQAALRGEQNVRQYNTSLYVLAGASGIVLARLRE